MKILLLLFMVGFGVEMNAQKLNGMVMDEKSEPIAFASVSLLQTSDSSFVAGTTTNEEGRFRIEAGPDGNLLKVSYVGYATQIIKPSQDMTIVLKEEGMTIGDVVITGSRPAYKMKDGALVAPVANTVLGKLGDANDVLTQLPMVSKSSKGYQVIGRGKPLIYINNRLMRDDKELEEIKSSDIKDIKVELNPGSRYSAEVGAVIKITTIRPTGEGLGGQLQSNYRHNAMDSYREQVDLNYRHRGLDVFVNAIWGSSSMKQNQSDKTNFQYKGLPISASESGTIITTTRWPRLTGGLNYSLDDKQMIGARYNFETTLDYDVDVNFKGIYTSGGLKSDFSTYQTVDIPIDRTHQVDAFYQNEICDQWQVNVDATYLNSKNFFNRHQTENREGAPAEVNSQTESKSSLWAVKAWSTNKWIGGTAEWGFELTDTRHEQCFLMLNEEVAQYIPNTENLSKQKAQCLFFSYSHPFGPINASIGLRYEHVDYNYEVNNQHDDEVSRTYSNLFPSVSFSYSKDKTSLSLSYRTIVKRPSYDALSSQRQYNSSYSVEGGNPQLQPAYQHSLAFIAQHHQWVLDAAYNYHQDAIMGDYYVLDDYPMMMSTRQNHDMHSWHVNVIWSPTIGFWKPSLMTGLSGQTLQLYNENFNGVGFDYQWKNLLTLPKDWVINVNMTGNSAKTFYLNRWRPNFEAELSVRKNIGNWQLTIGILDLFNTSRESFLRDVNGTHFDKHDNYNQQGFYLRAVYSFNPTKSKYKGGQAGQNELDRL